MTMTKRLGTFMAVLAMALQAAALAVGTTIAASIYPAWVASRMNIVDAIRHSR